nr:hypothetical protein [uncultured Bdellovibrio sp.]
MKSVIIAVIFLSSSFASAGQGDTPPEELSLQMVCNAIFSILEEKDMLACRDIGIAAGIDFRTDSVLEGYNQALDLCTFGDTSQNIKDLRQDALTGLRRVRDAKVKAIGSTNSLCDLL